MRTALFTTAVLAVMTILPAARAQGVPQQGLFIAPMPSPADDSSPRAAAPRRHRAQPAVSSPVSDSDGSVSGFGTSIPIGFAVKQIVPGDFLVNFGAGVDRNVRVSWTGGPDWHAVLEAALAPAGVSVTYVGQLVKLAAIPGAHPEAEAPAVPTQSVAEQAAPGDDAVPKAASRSRWHSIPAVVKPVPGSENYVENGTWHAAANDTLDEVLSDWCSKAGWHFVYNSRLIYTLQAPASFEGSFEDAASALIESVAANPHPMATFHRRNKALVITNSVEQAD